MSYIKDIVDVGQGIAATFAIIIAGVWTYLLFVRQRLKYPRAELDISVFSTVVGPNRRLIHAGLKVSNVGTVLLTPAVAELRVRQVVPVPREFQPAINSGNDPVEPGKTELRWPMIAGRNWRWKPNEFDIEPGEFSVLNSDFAIDGDIRVVQFYAYVENPAKRDKPLGWTMTEMHTFETVSESESMADQNNSERQESQQDLQKPQQQPYKQEEAEQQPQEPTPESEGESGSD